MYLRLFCLSVVSGLFCALVTHFAIVGVVTTTTSAVLGKYGLDETSARAYAQVKSQAGSVRVAPPAKPQNIEEEPE